MTAAGPGTPPGPVPSRTWAAWARALCVRSAAAGPARELVDDHRADVVAVAGVRRTGVAQSDDEPGSGVGHAR